MTWPDLIKLLVLDNMDAWRFWAMLLLAFIVLAIWAARPILVALIERPAPSGATPAPMRSSPPTAQPPPSK